MSERIKILDEGVPPDLEKPIPHCPVCHRKGPSPWALSKGACCCMHAPARPLPEDFGRGDE